MPEYLEFVDTADRKVCVHYSAVDTVIECGNYVTIYAGTDVYFTHTQYEEIKARLAQARRESLEESTYGSDTEDTD